MALDDDMIPENTEPSTGEDSLEVSTTIEESAPLPVLAKRKGNAYWNLLKTNGPYRLLVLADVLDLSGRWLSYLAILSIVETLSDSALALSGLLLVQRLPPTIMYPFVGVVADRFDRRRIMITALLLEMLIVLGFVGIYFYPNFILLYLLCWIQSSVDSFFQPARAGLVPCYVKGPDIIIANAIDGSLWSSCLFMGAAIGGVIAQLTGPVFCFIVDASTYAIAACLLMLLYRYPAPQSPVYQDSSSASEKTQTGSENEKEMGSIFSLEDEPDQAEKPEADQKERSQEKEQKKPNRVLTPEAMVLEQNLSKDKSALSQFLFGLSFMAVNPNILILALIKFLGSLVWGSCGVVEVKLAETEFVVNGSSFTSLAILYAILGIATGIAPVVAERTLSYLRLNESVRAREMAIIIGYFMLTIGVSLEGWSPNIFVFFAGCSLRSSGGAILWVFSTSLLQQWVDNKLQGRVFAFDLAAATLGEGSSIFLAGLLMDVASWSPRKVCLMYGAVIAIIIFGSWLTYYLLFSIKLEKRYFDKYPHLLNQHAEENDESETSSHGGPISPEIAASLEDAKDLIL